jgi:tetratricopeptide (TPR) repeat protein
MRGIICRLLLVLVSLLPASEPPAWAGSLEEARALADRGEHRRAADLLIAAADEAPATEDELILITRALTNAGDWKEAVDWGERAIEAAPERSEAHLQYARALRVRMQNISKMRAMFGVGDYKKELRLAIELDPGNVAAHEEQIGYLIYAPGIAGGDKKEAARRIEELKALDWRAGMWMQADLQRETEETDGLIVTYGEMVERDEDDLSAREALAFALQGAGRYRDADRHFALLLDSGERRRSLGARYQLARSRILGEYEAELAVEYLKKYIERLGTDRRGLPSESHAYWRLGLAYGQLDRADDARRSLERALELDRDNDEARAALKRLARG